MDFQQRLQKAVERGHRRGEEEESARQAKQLSEEELKQLHSRFRLQLSEHIEQCMQQLPDHLPGFQYETMFGDRGWGAACKRDDIGPGTGGKRTNYYSRLEMTVRPYSKYHVLELSAKGTVRNKELYSRNHFVELPEVDPTSFLELIDLWVLEYAEQFAAQ